MLSLRARLLVGMAAIGLVLAVAATFTVRSTRANLTAQVDDQLDVSADTLLRDHGRPGAGGRFGPRERLTSVYFGFVSTDGNVVTVLSPNFDPDQPLPVFDADRALASASDHRYFNTGSQRTGWRYRAVALPASKDGVEGAAVVAMPLHDVDRSVRRLIAVEGAATLAILAVLGLVTWWVIRLGVDPIKKMTKTASAIAEGDLSQRVADVQPGTEAGDLGVALNSMLGTIETAFDERARSEDRLRQFVADASHELRTPVTTIRGYAELYRSGALEEPTEMTEAMRRTEQEAIRMGSLVDDMLHLARLDQGRPMEKAPVDLAILAADAIRDAQAVDPDRPITFVGDPNVVVLGDDDRLRQVIGNLVGNAMMHTAPTDAIEVQVHRVDGRAVLEVTDHGPGMPASAAERAFERFYRADPSRSRHQGGSGLGLSIVHGTVTAHGGTVAMRTAPGRGTSVRVELPLLVPVAPADHSG